MKRGRATIEEAREQGYDIDTHTYPWTAYKGPRFRPLETIKLFTPAWPPKKGDAS